MPGGDRTGPLGQGPVTGRGAGSCRGSGGGRGRGLGNGPGMGRGHRSAEENEAETPRRESNHLDSTLEEIKKRLEQLESK